MHLGKENHDLKHKLFYTVTHIFRPFSLYLQATFKGWMDIMYAAVDSREVIIFTQFSTEAFHVQ